MVRNILLQNAKNRKKMLKTESALRIEIPFQHCMDHGIEIHSKLK